MDLKEFRLNGRVAIVTGGAGHLAFHHAKALCDAGAHVVLADIDLVQAERQAGRLRRRGARVCAVPLDVGDLDSVERLLKVVLKRFSRADILINNAALNPKVGQKGLSTLSRLEEFPLSQWEAEIRVGLTGAFLCAKTFGQYMAKNGGGVILNVASDLSVIAPDQRIYFRRGFPKERQSVKPVSYSVVKTGLVGLTRYLATYWADRGVRVNALSPGGVYAGQPDSFVKKLTDLIPMGRMAREDEYRGAVVFLCSNASRYMTGQNVVMDGGRSVW